MDDKLVSFGNHKIISISMIIRNYGKLCFTHDHDDFKILGIHYENTCIHTRLTR